MQNEFQPEENPTPQTAYLPTVQTPPTAQTETEAQATQAVIERLNEITQRAHRAKRRFGKGMVAVSACLVIGALLTIDLLGEYNPLYLPLVRFIMITGIIAFGLLDRTRSRTMPKFDVAEITRLGGVRSIPPLFATSQLPIPEEQKQAIRSALTMLLPQMKASDAHLITPSMREYINSLFLNFSVTPNPNQSFICFLIAALKALEQVGDSNAIFYVERLANIIPRMPGQAKVKQAAIECLPMLRANCGEVETARTLLRASQAEDVRPDTLLRPASGAGQTGAAELLRGSDSPDARPSEGQA